MSSPKLVKVFYDGEWIYGYDEGPHPKYSQLRTLHVPRDEDWPVGWTSEHRPIARLSRDFESVGPGEFFAATGLVHYDLWYPYTMAS
jgi:hypothetical protein